MGQSVPFAASPIAFLSDIHGNLPALEAVLSELDERSVKHVVALGDHLLGGADPLGVWRRLQSVEARLTSGPSDLALAQLTPDELLPQNEHETEMAEEFSRTRSAIGDLVVEQLRRLPEQLRVPLMHGGELVAVHGSPVNPLTECSHEMSDDEIMELLGDDPADLVVCGSSHVPFERFVAGVQIVNVGSVGDAPEGGVAHFAIVDPSLEGPKVEPQWVSYDA